MKTKVIENGFVTGFQTYSLSEDKYQEPVVNWAAIGSVSIEEARKFAQSVLDVCDKIDAQYWD
ncbi:hypothetical protein NVP1090B_29 [Vibrio phage 1.090.B._10N.286.48.F1]|nr:hypothetical protein NVP1090B_29 [Vibrio phage 1.090.B._10N.286.48.F1]